jgi:phospholipid/cholesterol/gamma-HCH transport system permease protein
LLDALQCGRYAFGDPDEIFGRRLTKMPEASETLSVTSRVGNVLKLQVLALQDYSLLAMQSVANLFTPPQYWKDTLDQMDLIGVGSLPIVIVASFFIGGVLVINTSAQLQRFGMAALTGDGVSLALVRELGPTITAILVTGRNASSIASELGSMVVTEQVDAMRALGTDPVRKLMTPRVVAMLTMLPLLVVVADVCGLLGGSIVAYLTLKLGAVQFWTRAKNALAFGDIIQGLAKPIIFGFLISTIGCYEGLRVKGGTQGVGRATISAVVASCLSILISDFFLTKLFLNFLYK